MDGTPGAAARPRLRWRFADACFDEASLILSIAGRPVELERRPLQLLALLLDHAGEIVTKDEILDALWAGREVTEASLTKCMTRLRQALGETGYSAIRTVHGYGYRFMADVAVEAVASSPAAVSAGPPFAAGDPLPHRPDWHLRANLGAGGHGEAWLAGHGASRQQIVVKFALGEAGASAMRREVALSRLLREGLGPRPDLIRILGWNFAGPRAFIEMEWAEQGNLADWAARQGGADAVPLALRLELAAQIAEALAAIHSMAVLHKDLKPANVLIRIGEDGHPGIILTDFGSGRALDPSRLDGFGITRPDLEAGPDGSSGTHMYRAPEVFAGASPTIQADIFALGVLLFQLAAGDLRRPLAAGWEQLIADPLLREDIAAAASGDPARRLTDAADLAARLRALPERRAARAKALADAAEAARLRRALDLARARRQPLIALLGFLVAGFAVSTTLYVRAESAQARAEAEAARARAVTAFLTDDLFSAANPLLGADPGVPVRGLLDLAAADLDRRFPPGAADRAAIEAAIGSAFAGLADHDKAFPLLRGALGALRAQRGEDDPQTQAVRLSMARLAEHMLDRPAMRAIGQEMLASHPSDAATAFNARFYVIIGGCDSDAEACVARLRPLAADCVRRLGVHDPVTLKIEAELASRLGDSLRFAEAIPMARALIAQTQTVYGRDHLLVQERRFELAATLVEAGQTDEAIPMLIDVRRRFLALMGTETAMSARVENQLGRAYFYAGRYADALPPFTAARAYFVATLGETNPMSLGAAENIANTLAHLGHTKDAILLAQHAFDLKRRAEGADAPDTLWFERDLAVDDRMDGNLPQAEALYRDVNTRARAIMTHGEHVLGQYQVEFGEVLMRLDKSEEARAVLAEGVATLRASFGAMDHRTQQAQRLLDSLGSQHEAAKE